MELLPVQDIHGNIIGRMVVTNDDFRDFLKESPLLLGAGVKDDKIVGYTLQPIAHTTVISTPPGVR